MEIYNDEKNKSGMKVLFMFMQMLFFLFVYTIIYTSLLGVRVMIEQKGGSIMLYIPIVIALILFPIMLYKYRQMFAKGRMLAASIWTISISFLSVVLLYAYLSMIVE